MLGAVQTTIRYAKKNGLRAAIDAVCERLEQRRIRYEYAAPAEEELEEQRGRKFQHPLKISILVPAYETPEDFLQDLILSVTDQTYEDYELIIADASESDAVKAVVLSFQEQYGRIVYFRTENRGISENTNAALEKATGDYVALLDHDDLLTKDALYRVREAIDKATQSDGAPVLIYSDEDKCSEDLERYYEPNRKKDYDPEMLLTNNYICHLSVYRADVIRRLKLRKEYDGSQDYDLILRACRIAEEEGGAKRIVHIPQVLYHWRCHESSTASNPGSKEYAYEAGRRAILDALKEKGLTGLSVSDTKHHGFYHVDYGEKIFSLREDIGVIGGPLYEEGYMAGGLTDAEGKVVFDGLKKGYSGTMHRADLQQEAFAVDVRNMRVRDELIPLYEKMFGTEYPCDAQKTEDAKKLRSKSFDFCKKVREQGYKIFYDPLFTGGEE